MADEPQALMLIGREAAVLREFMGHFRYAFEAFLREAPRPSPDVDYKRRLTDREANALWIKLYGVPLRVVPT